MTIEGHLLTSEATILIQIDRIAEWNADRARIIAPDIVVHQIVLLVVCLTCRVDCGVESPTAAHASKVFAYCDGGAVSLTVVVQVHRSQLIVELMCIGILD